MKTNVWIMNHYASSMLFDKGGRHYNFAKYLKPTGYNPVIFCANSKHNATGCFFETDALWHEHHAEEIGVPFVFVKARSYTGNGKQRILNMIDFYRNVKKAAKEYAKQHGNPDVIYASSVHPLTLLAGIELAKSFGVKCICEMRDLWPESFVVLQPDRFSRDSLIIKLLYQGEKWIYKKADRLIFTGEGCYKYIQDQGWDKEIPKEKTFYINNGVDLDQFRDNIEKFQMQDDDLDNPGLFNVTYAGAIRMANGLQELVDCAAQLKEHHNIRFLIYGNGEDLERLQNYCKSQEIYNVIFKAGRTARIGKRFDECYILCRIGHATSSIVLFRQPRHPQRHSSLYGGYLCLL